MPDDHTPLTSVGIDATTRSAWLLAASRSLHPDGAVAERGAFTQAVVDLGVPADLSRMSRWESGQLPVSDRLLGAYESILSTPPLALRGLTRLLRRHEGAHGHPEVRHQGGEPRPDVAGQLIEGVLATDEITGSDWLALSLELERFDFVFLRDDDWRALCLRLVEETVRTRGLDQALRYEALATLVTSPVSRRHVMHSLGIWVTAADCGSVGPLLSLLTLVPDPAAGRLVTRLLDDGRPAIAGAAMDVVADLVAREQLDLVGLKVAEQHALRGLLDERVAGSPELLNLLAALPTESFSKALEPVRTHWMRTWALAGRETRMLMPVEVGRALTRRLATDVQAATPSPYAAENDAMLQRLLTETLFHVSSQRRRVAGWLVASSPYGPAACDLLHELAVTSHDPVRERAVEALWLVATPESALGEAPVPTRASGPSAAMLTAPPAGLEGRWWRGLGGTVVDSLRPRLVQVG
ncbi:hypothetical protein [Nocardioides sp. GY 10127]|uniref:hypothetical protein n=1 Tax=Nocardioides sp. GY 10127 TaxID=2569762 RepID=UPI0010A920D6|nr:hypothetical protein [Nocardioides sp. GY 10127]TIC81663.1 hypothetical protein E8D37_10705 [Nocardioides sp. GY 10127]